MKTLPFYWILISLLSILLSACVTNGTNQSPKPNSSPSPQDQDMTNSTEDITYLALGDSYTIGEGVSENDTYPAQLAKLLSAKGVKVTKPKIIATTGWTTDELQQGIDAANIRENTYSIVTLLIGVNNQYRGRTVENYKAEFEQLLDEAVAFADGHASRVVVISIPDWGVTRFAEQQQVDQEKIAAEIDAYNRAQQVITEGKNVTFIDITEKYRQIGHLEDNMAADGLHPSGNVYRYWAQQLEGILVERL
ncbi:SGNH/GDSL hydrolase family protein [Echinicola strongylocentroti]|uniref:SGNH/GDSL hydrolase family protein n=1 Tax=Echinicola strongylocentroti TaxID=1795355 RepID=A0A2Z4ILQ0_9BACT|nr:SGNH/GDSL hydrolase family protein [Echinicola strongylocentroti]AWW31647.1 SGNH/GDSL hydrolase family protein [Echinicola strongylocentroti]